MTSKIEKMYLKLDTKPFYLRRELNPNTVTTSKNETVRLAQSDNIVYPTVRMMQPGKGGTGNTRLKKLSVKDALQLAKNKRDFIIKIGIFFVQNKISFYKLNFFILYFKS